MPNFHEFLVIKENAEFAGYFLLLSLPHSPSTPLPQRLISAAKFDTVIIGCHGGLLPTGDFHKGRHFPSFTKTFGVAESKLQVSKNDAACLPVQ